MEVEVVALREHSSCIGGTILALRMCIAHDGQRGQWIVKEEYDEAGPSSVHHKCF